MIFFKPCFRPCVTRRALAAGLFAVFFLAVLMAAAILPLRHVSAAPQPLTWRGQIAPLVYAHCAACHHPGGSGPFDLTTYAAAKRRAPQIADVVQSRYMPPWLPQPTGGPQPVHFQDDRSLKPAEIEQLVAWVRAGAPEGAGPEPKPPVFPDDWQLGPPDLVLEMPEAVTEPASGADIFVNFILPATVTQTRWIRALEIKPAAGNLVHHANLILDRTDSLRRQHPGDWRQGIPGMDLQIDSGDSFDPDSHFLFWKPDSTALIEPPGMPWRLDPGDDLILNMHLKPTGRPERIRARVGLYFASQPARAHPMLLQLEHDRALDIPPGDPSFVVTDELKLPVAVDLLALYPHAHYLCREMEAWATLPDGRRQPLLLIRNWDIDRQAVYPLAQPLALPAGSVVHMRYTYDNSAANVHNPSSPPVRVRGGNRATDEMSHLWLEVLPRGEGSAVDPAAPDLRLALERAWMEDVLRKSPDDPIALYNLGALAQSRGEAQQAIAFYRRLLLVHPGDARALTALGSAEQSAGDAASARRDYDSALAADPASADALFDLAALELNEGHPGPAVLLLRRAIAVRDQPDARRLLAMAYSAQGDAGQTLEQLHAWLALSPQDPAPHRALAQVLAAQGRLPEALSEQRAVLALAGANPDDWNDLGVLQVHAGDRTAAAESFRHALQLDPANTSARRYLGLLGVAAEPAAAGSPASH